MTKFIYTPACLSLVLALTGCGQSTGSSSLSREQSGHEEVFVVDPSTLGSSQGTGDVAAAAISIGSIYLETQLAPLTVTGTQLQASDVTTNGADGYVTYAAKDAPALVIKKGAVEHVKASNCDNIFTPRTEYCLSSANSLTFLNDDIFAAYSDGSNVWVTGSTADETIDGKYARIYKLNLDAAKNPASIAVTRALASYAGTGITKVGTSLLVTTGTSTVTAMMGGLEVMNASSLAAINSQPLFDARSVVIDPANTALAYVVRGAVDINTPGVVSVMQADGAQPPSRTIATGGNFIAESKSSVQVGQRLLLTSLGTQGFRVSCKASGASLAVVPAPIITGIDPGLTVTNSALAIKGYILAANGEAGVYLYQFQKKSALSTDLCADGVTVTLVGRLTLAKSTSYSNGELSANSIKYLPIFDLLNLNILSAKLVVVGSGNKGISMLNLSGLTLSLTDVDDF